MKNIGVLVYRSRYTVVIEAMPYTRATTERDTHMEFESALRDLIRLRQHATLDDFLDACSQTLRPGQ